MTHYSVRVEGDLEEAIEQYIDVHKGSKSEALRELLRRGTVYDSVQRERDRLHRAQTQLIERREENQELVEYVAEERSIRERRQERQNAPVWRRAKWWVLGRTEG